MGIESCDFVLRAGSGGLEARLLLPDSLQFISKLLLSFAGGGILGERLCEVYLGLDRTLESDGQHSLYVKAQKDGLTNFSWAAAYSFSAFARLSLYCCSSGLSGLALDAFSGAGSDPASMVDMVAAEGVAISAMMEGEQSRSIEILSYGT